MKAEYFDSETGSFTEVTVKEVDFTRTKDHRQLPSGVIGDTETPRVNRPQTPDGKLLTPKQIRARMRRRAKRAEVMTDTEFNAIYKPIEEWDLDELAHGRPRGPTGKFSGPTPKWITREVHEKSMERFKAAIKSRMNGETPSAIDAISWVLGNNEVDEKGKPLVPPSTKLDAAKFLLEHVVGKPTQRVESDVSVRLQAILGVVMANPNDALVDQGYSVGHLPGVTMPMALEGVEDAEEVDDDDFTLE